MKERVHEHLKGMENSEKRVGREGKIDKKREHEAWKEIEEARNG